MRSNPITNVFDMTSLCPHLFQEYLHRVSEIIGTYKAQILVLVEYKVIADSLLTRHVVKRREHMDIFRTEDQKEQMEKLILILQKRMWGLENFITVLIEKNVDTWLAEELFGAYVRHLVVKMKEIQAKNNICSCFHGGNNSVLYRSWLQALTKFDGWLTEIGGALGFLTLTMHPVKSVLNFINERLPITRKRIVLINPTETLNDSDSDNSDEEDAEVAEQDQYQEESANSQFTEPPILPAKNPISGSSLDFTQFHTQNKLYAHPIQLPLQRCISSPTLKTNSSTSTFNSANENYDATFDASAWNEPKVVRRGGISKTPEDMMHASDPYDIDSLLELIAAEELDLQDSKPTSISTWTLYNSDSEDEALFNTVSRHSAAASSACLIPAASVSTQTSPIASPEFRTRSHSLPESAIDQDSKETSSSVDPVEETEEIIENERNQKRMPSIVKPSPVIRKPVGNSNSAIATQTSRKASSSTVKSPVNSTSRPSTFVLRKPSSLNSSTSVPRLSTPKVATITPRQRVLDAYKAKKANASPQPPPVHEERLKPQDYNFQQWSNTWVGRKDGQSQGGSVA